MPSTCLDPAERCAVCPPGASSPWGKDRDESNSHTGFLRVQGTVRVYDGEDLTLPWGWGLAITPPPGGGNSCKDLRNKEKG